MGITLKFLPAFCTYFISVIRPSPYFNFNFSTCYYPLHSKQRETKRMQGQRKTSTNPCSHSSLVQSLNSPFFPPHIGAEPGRAKEESRITCMRMLRTPPFFPPKPGEKPYLEVLSKFSLWRDFLNENIQATISAFRLIKNMSINPKSVEFHRCHAKPHSICFFFIISSKITKEIFAKIC